MTTTTNNQESKTLLIIDSGVENYEALVEGVEEGVEVHVLAGDSDGIGQVTTIINTAASTGVIDALHIVSDGSPGYIQLGNGALSNNTIENYESALSGWTQALSEEACILVYASQVAGDDRGKELIDRLGEITGAEIAASEDDTGNAGSGGDWDLEYSTGTIAADVALTSEVRETYGDLLSAVITVTNTNDSGAGSLREAIAQARDGETIEFDESLADRTITLTSGQLEIDIDLIIDGANTLKDGGEPSLTISGNNSQRVIDVKIGSEENPQLFTLRNLIVANGKTNGVSGDGAGAGIRTDNHGILTIENSVFRNNNANGEGGGAIYGGFRSTNTIISSLFEGNSSSGNSEANGIRFKGERGGGAIAVKSLSDTTVLNSTFNNNTGTNGGAINIVLGGLRVENSTFIENQSIVDGGETTGVGGAIFTDGASDNSDESVSGTISIINSLFEGNTAEREGGGMFLFAYPPDKVIVKNSTIINNQTGGIGGGIRQGNGEFEIANTTIANNHAGQHGGGLYVGERAPLTITNSTLSGNRAEGDGVNLGGAIYFANTVNDESFTNNITNSTIAYNYASTEGGGLWGQNPSGTLTNTIFAYNEGGEARDHHTNKTLNNGGGNIQSIELNSDDTLVTEGVTLADPLLDELQEINGVLVHPLLPASPAIDGGVNSGAPATDQLGTERPIDGDGNGTAIFDSGAYEFSGDSEPPADGCSLDIDDNGEIDPFTDGRLIMFYLFFGNLDVIDDAVIGSAIGPGANRNTRDEITNYLDSACDTMLDVDGNGVPDAQTDGILIMRYMFEIIGESLISGALAPDATRITPDAVIEFLQQFDPRVTGIQAQLPFTSSIGF